MSKSDERVPQRVFDIIHESTVDGHDNVTILVLAQRINILEEQIREMMNISENLLKSRPSTIDEKQQTHAFFLKHP